MKNFHKIPENLQKYFGIYCWENFGKLFKKYLFSNFEKKELSKLETNRRKI